MLNVGDNGNVDRFCWWRLSGMILCRATSVMKRHRWIVAANHKSFCIFD